MKKLIYQVWSGTMRPIEEHSSKVFKEYAERIGADYRLDENPGIASKNTDVPNYYEKLNMLFDDAFLEYDRVLYVDLDVFPVAGCDEDVFHALRDHEDLGVCQEPIQPKLRTTVALGGGIDSQNDERFAKLVKENYGTDLPRNSYNLLKVYNSGMMLWSRQGIMKARDKFDKIQNYVNIMRRANMPRFYHLDQNYVHAMMCTHLDYQEMRKGWNCYVHYVRGPTAYDYTKGINDGRSTGFDGKTKFVHIQLSGSGDMNADQLDTIVNRPIEEWPV